MTCIYYFSKYVYISDISLTKNLHVSNVLIFLTFVVWVPEDGSDEPKHVARCCIAMKCCLCFNYSKHSTMHSSITTYMNTVTSLTGEWQRHILNHPVAIAYNNITKKRTLVYCKWLHKQWPPTCFGQPGGRLQGGKTQRMDTLEDKIVKFQNQSKYIKWHNFLNQIAAPDVHLVDYVLLY